MNRQEKKGYLISLLSIFSFVAIWQFVSLVNVAVSEQVSSPASVMTIMGDVILNGYLADNLFPSLKILFIGLVGAIISGSLFAFFLNANKYSYYIFRPFIFGLSALPKIALLPLFIIWFGFGYETKILIIYLMAVIPIIINVYEGARNTDAELLRMARSFGAGKFSAFRTVIFWSSLPFIFAGMKIAVGRAIIGLVVAEMFGYGKGLGHLLNFYGTTENAPSIMMVASVLLILNLLLVSSVNFLEKKIVNY